MDYENVVGQWVDEKVSGGMSQEEAKRSVLADVQELYKAAIHQLPIRANLDELRTYVKEHGFHHQGKTYFRASWMSAKYRKQLENSGVIRKEARYYSVDTPLLNE